MLQATETAARLGREFSVEYERELWVVAIILYGPVDSILTIFNMEAGGFEANAVARWFLDAFGYTGLFIHKLLFFAVIGAALIGITAFARKLDQPPAPYRLVFAVMFALRGLVLVQNHVTVYLALT